MSTLLLFWIGIGLVFLIVEMITAAFYGLSIAIAAFVLALYCWFMGIDSIDIWQWVIFAVTTFCSAYFLPKLLTSNAPDIPQGIDKYIGERRKVKKVGDDFKIVLDGVDHMVVGDDDIDEGMIVEVISTKWGKFHVKKA